MGGQKKAGTVGKQLSYSRIDPAIGNVLHLRTIESVNFALDQWLLASINAPLRPSCLFKSAHFQFDRVLMTLN
jgi:hypothetical protein